MKTRYLSWLPAALLLTNCGWSPSQKEENELIDKSALFEPPVLTLMKGKPYETKEGIYTPKKDAMFYSKYRYLRAITIGK